MHEHYDTLIYLMHTANHSLATKRLAIPITYIELLAYLYKADREMETVTRKTLEEYLNWDDNDMHLMQKSLVPLYIETQTIRVNYSRKPVHRFTLTPTGTLYVESLLAIMEGV